MSWERAHQGIKVTMRVQWEKDARVTAERLADIAAHVHNAVPNQSTTISPRHAMFGTEIADVDMRNQMDGGEVTAREWTERHEALLDFVRARLRDLTEHQTEPYRDIKVGSWVVRAVPHSERVNRKTA